MTKKGELWGRPSARVRAEASVPLADVGRDSEERLMTSLADAFNGTSPCAVLQKDHGLVIADTRTTTSLCPMGVARSARRDEVVGRVIRPIKVQVIGNDGPRARPSTWKPIDLLVTPMARMRSGSDPVVKGDAGKGDLARRWSEWVSRPLASTSLHNRVFACSTHRLVIAGQTAKPTGSFSVRGLVGSTAGLARVHSKQCNTNA